jgi:intracellular sulfur oxidation DsrE/DsrF family protein
VVFHIDRDDQLQLKIALGNIKNLFKEVVDANAIILANFNAPALFLKSNIDKETYDLLKNLKNYNMNVYICENSLKMLNISKTDVIEGCIFVKAGIVELIALQIKGFAYIKP